MEEFETIKLPYSTSNVIEGPILAVLDEGNKLIVKYDFTDFSGGETSWTEVTFLGLRAFNFIDGEFCGPSSINAFNHITYKPTSKWLQKVIKKLKKRFPEYATEDRVRVLRHWEFYFDKVGCIDIAAQSVKIN